MESSGKILSALRKCGFGPLAIPARAFELRVQRHRIVTATLALQPSLRTHYHWAEFVPQPAVSATEDLLVHRHQVAVDLNRPPIFA